MYEDGYAKQYDLSSTTAERAWLDTIRMMQKGGFSQSDIQQKIKDKLSPGMQETLKQYHRGDAELVILEHQGFIPDKSEMTLIAVRRSSSVLFSVRAASRRRNSADK